MSFPHASSNWIRIIYTFTYINTHLTELRLYRYQAHMWPTQLAVHCALSNSFNLPNPRKVNIYTYANTTCAWLINVYIYFLILDHSLTKLGRMRAKNHHNYYHRQDGVCVISHPVEMDGNNQFVRWHYITNVCLRHKHMSMAQPLHIFGELTSSEVRKTVHC